MYNKALYGFMGQEIPPVDEEAFERLNDIRITPVPDLDKVATSIDKWLK